MKRRLLACTCDVQEECQQGEQVVDMGRNMVRANLRMLSLTKKMAKDCNGWEKCVQTDWSNLWQCEKVNVKINNKEKNSRQVRLQRDQVQEKLNVKILVIARRKGEMVNVMPSYYSQVKINLYYF